MPLMALVTVTAALVLLATGMPGATAVAPARLTAPFPPACSRCGWHPPAASATETVGTLRELEQAVRQARPGTTILVRPGTYDLAATLDITSPHVVLRGEGDRSQVVLRGGGMRRGDLGVAISIAAANVTIADLTIEQVANHGVQVRGERGASGAFLHNLRIADAGQQLVKVSHGLAGRIHADGGTLACSLIEYTDHAPSDYTSGIDIIGGQGWVVRDNAFRRIHGPATSGWRAGPAILAWGNSIDTIVERNLVLDSFRGIALGIGPGGTPYARDGEAQLDHRRGVIRNNVVSNRHLWADEGIEVNAATAVRIEHNTVLVEGLLVRRAISLRFASSNGIVRNNLTNRPIALRDGAAAAREGNVEGASAEWFVNADRANLRLAGGSLPPVAAGVPIDTNSADFDRTARPSGVRPDAGAFQHARH